MIVVRVELWSAKTGLKTELGRMEIANDGTSTDERYGDYEARLLRKPDFGRITRSTKIVKHGRKHLTIWHLVAKALRQMGYTT